MKGKICFLLKWHPQVVMGGAELQSWYLARGLAARGWEVHYISENSHPASAGDVLDGVHLHWLPMRKPELTILNDRPLHKILSEIKADLYYQRVGGVYTGLISRSVKKLGGKFVFALSTPTDAERWFETRSFRADARRGWKRTARLPLLLLNDYLYHQGVRASDCIVTQNKEQYSRLQQTWNRTSTIIHSGHPIPPGEMKKSEPRVISWIANLRRTKQPEVFLQLAAACRHLNVQFVMAGDPADPVYGRAVLEQLPKMTNLSFLGKIPLERAFKILEKSSIFVNTSPYEGFPNTLVQSWLRYTPTVTLSVDPDQIITKQGLGICAGNFETLVSSISRLIADETLRSEMGLRARKYAEENHSLDGMLEQYQNLFIDILQQNGQP